MKELLTTLLAGMFLSLIGQLVGHLSRTKENQRQIELLEKLVQNTNNKPNELG